MDFSGIATCFEVTDEIVDDALRPAKDMNEQSPRERVFALLEHIAAIAKPKQGAARILRVLARIAACDWVDGDLDVRVVSHGVGTAIELFVNDGLSVSKMRDPLELGVPYEELKKALASKPDLLRPLIVSGQVGATKTRLVAQTAAGASVPPLSAADAALFFAAPMPAPRPATKRPPRNVPAPPPPRARAMTMIGFAEPPPPAPIASPPPRPPPPSPPAAIGKLTLTKRQVPASRRSETKSSDRSAAPRPKETSKSSGKRPPKSPRT